MRIPLVFATLASFLAVSPALAQFPPPGVYACVDGAGAVLGELSLFVAGDYTFARPDGSSGKGQVASAGTDINPLSGPLKEMGLTGVFGTDEAGNTVFRFVGADGVVVECR